MSGVTQATVDQNLNAAIENHYENILEWSTEDIALDLLAFADDCCSSSVEELTPLIDDWRSRRAAVLKIKVYKIELLVEDFDNNGIEELTTVIENQRFPNHCMSPQVIGHEVREIEWSDGHPLNITSTRAATAKELFAK